jgi:hypothetical protein
MAVAGPAPDGDGVEPDVEPAGRQAAAAERDAIPALSDPELWPP